jgi:hypothetical protein
MHAESREGSHSLLHLDICPDRTHIIALTCVRSVSSAAAFGRMTKPSGNPCRQPPNGHSCHLVFVSALLAFTMIGRSADATGFQQWKSFSWRASIDRKTGEATATETSMSRRRCNGAVAHRVPTSGCDKNSLINLLKSYPEWLSSRSVSFGILHTRSLLTPSDVTRNRTNRTRALNGMEALTDCAVGISINDSLFGLNLLCFGSPRSSATTKKTTAGGRRRILQVDFPVIGGLLDGKQRQAKVSSSKILSEHGCIRFVVEQEEMRGEDETQQGRKGWHVVRIKSSICGGYCPAITGTAPVNIIRKVAYLSSQSLIHAYVMWRFHGKVWANTREDEIAC